MSNEVNKAVVRRWFEALEQGRAGEVAQEVYASQYILHDPGAPPDLPPGPQGVIRFISLTTRFPNSVSPPWTALFFGSQSCSQNGPEESAHAVDAVCVSVM